DPAPFAFSRTRSRACPMPSVGGPAGLSHARRPGASRQAPSSSPGVGHDRLRRVPPGAARDSAARVGARSTQVETADPGEAVARVAEEWSPCEELVERVLAVHRVPAGQAVLAL